MRHTALVIDDSKTVFHLVQAWLKEDSIDCLFAPDGAAGLESALKAALLRRAA